MFQHTGLKQMMGHRFDNNFKDKKTMITKEQFVNAINVLQKQEQIDEGFAENVGKVFPLAFTANLLPPTGIIKNGYLKLLGDVMRDEFGFIDWFCYDCDFGKEPKIMMLEWKEYKPESAEELYDILMKPDG